MRFSLHLFLTRIKSPLLPCFIPNRSCHTDVKIVISSSNTRVIKNVLFEVYFAQKQIKKGTVVNIEFDILGKYIAKILRQQPGK